VRSPGSIYVSFLDPFLPSWAPALVRELGGLFLQEVRHLDAPVDLRPAYSPERNQYHATLLLASLLRTLPEPGARILGVTGVDLYIPVLTFVFGQAQLAGPGAILSTYRLQNEFYGLPPDPDKLLDRVMKEAVHELGHSFGLIHCPDFRCVMNASTYVEEVDLKGDWYCRECEARMELPGRALG
jgi:archaemetzincin